MLVLYFAHLSEKMLKTARQESPALAIRVISRRTLNRKSLARAGLPVRKNRSVIPGQTLLDSRFSHFFEHLILRCLLACDIIERVGFGGG